MQAAFKIMMVILGVSIGTAFGQGKTQQCSANFVTIPSREINLNGKTLYSIDADHFLEPFFDKKCKLIQITVTDKARWNDEDDKSVGFTSGEYKQLFGRVAENYPIGEILESDAFGISSPRGTTTWSRFQNALVHITSFITGENGEQKGFIVCFTIYFAHEVEGKLTERVLFDSSGLIKRSKISIDGSSYWTDQATFSGTAVNQVGTFKVFGGPVL
jgi:hypothetical protein